jgi:hypothetical protein
MTNGDDIQTGHITGNDITIGKDILHVSGNAYIQIINNPPLQKVVSNLSEDNVIEATHHFIEALQNPDIAKKFQQALAETNQEQQESTNDVELRQTDEQTAYEFGLAAGSIDPFADPIEPLRGADIDINLLLLKINERLEKRLKGKMVILSNKIDSMEKPTQIDIVQLQQILATLQKLYELKYSLTNANS